MPYFVTFDAGAGELDREPVTEEADGIIETDAFKEAIERLVARIGFFSPGDVIRVVEG